MSSYILFSQTSTPNGTRDKWSGAGDSGGQTAPGNSAPGSTFSADKLGSAVLPNAAAAADYGADGVRMTSQTALFDISQTGGGGFTAQAAAATSTLETQFTDGGNKLFGPSNTKLNTSKSDVELGTGKLWLAVDDKNWDAIKNLEIKLDSESSFRDIRLENFVDTRLKLGDDLCDIVAKNTFKTFDVQLIGTKRGEVDASFASDNLKLEIEVWSDTKDWQNSFDLKGTAYGDQIFIGAGTVGSGGYKACKPGSSTDDGRDTKVFANLGAGDDLFDSTNTLGDPLKSGGSYGHGDSWKSCFGYKFDNGCGTYGSSKNEFRSVDKVWGASGDDIVRTGGGDDIIFGDNGSGANFYADPASIAHDVANDFLVGRLNGLPGAVPGFIGGNGGDNLGTSFDAGDYTIIATGGNLMQLRTGPAPHAGGLGIRSADDPPVGPPLGNGDPLGSAEIDRRGTDEAITFDFKTGAHEVEIDLTAFWDNEGPNGTLPEVALYTVFLTDGTSFGGSVVANNHVFPAAFTIAVDESDTGGKLIDKITLAPSAVSGEFSDFFVTALRACTVVPGAEGNDKLDGGNGCDFIQGDGDTGVLKLIAAGSNLIVNGGFEDFDPNQAVVDHGHFLTFTGIPGWSTATNPLIEIQVGAATGGLAPHGGNAKLELDSHPDAGAGTNADVQQIVDAAEGLAYVLNFFYSPRSPDGGAGSSGFEVFWNGAKVFTFNDPDPGAAGWKSSGNIVVTGAAGADKLEFRATGLENTLGALIDDVSLKAKKSFVDISCPGDQIWVGCDGNKDTVNFNTGDGFDIVRQFDPREDVLRMQGTTAAVTTQIVSTAEGLSTLVQDGAGGAVLLIGVTQALTEMQDGLFVRLT